MSGKLLIVEDEALIAATLEACAHDLGYTDVAVASGESQAVDLLSAFQPDAMVLDVNLNGRKSFRIARAAASRGVPFVFASAYDKNDIPLDLLRVPVLAKPYTCEAFRRALLELRQAAHRYAPDEHDHAK